MFLLRFFRLVRVAFWRAFWHDAFGVAKGSAYSSILTLFPALMVIASILAATERTAAIIREISTSVVRIMPPGTGPAVRAYFESTQQRPVRVLVLASLITLWTASGVMLSWMEGFRTAYQLPKTWGIFKERFIAFGLVIMAGIPLCFATGMVAFGSEIEVRTAEALGQQFGPYVLLTWTGVRWLIGILTSIAVIALIYHNAVPRTQPWHSVLPGATLATAMWFPATILFGWYVRHFAQYSLFYGSLATAVVLLIWLYIVSVIVLVGAEFNAILFPRAVFNHDHETPLANENVQVS